MKLKNNVKITGRIHCDSGLHIGGQTDKLEIGGVDLPVIKNPISGEPYVPGSSLKGKMRSSLERKYGRLGGNESDQPCGCGKEDCPVCRIFGPHKNTKHRLGPTRILVRDAYYTEETKKMYTEMARDQGIGRIEYKTENIINRSKGTAEHPRTMERVPEGTEFELLITLQVMDTDNEEEMKKIVREGLQLVEETYLGGYGSRGSGKVSFKDLKYDGNPF